MPAQLTKAGIERFPINAALSADVTTAADLEQMFEFALCRLLDGLTPLLDA